MLLTNSIFLVCPSREIERRLIQTKVHYKLCYSVSKEASQKPLKAAAAKKSFPNVFIIDTTCFHECFLFYVITGNSTFCTNLTQPRGLVQPPCCCVLWNKCFESSHFMYLCYLHNNITMVLIPKVQNKASNSYIFSKKKFADSVSFTLSHFVNVPHFSLFFHPEGHMTMRNFLTPLWNEGKQPCTFYSDVSP